MACVVVPMVEAVVTTITAKVMESKEKALEVNSHTEVENSGALEKISFSRKLKWLNNMLWGGSALLVFEHVWHGEIAPWFPFLTAASNPADTAEMLSEMSTAGVAMSVLVTAAWVGMVAITSAIEKKSLKAQTSEN